VFGRLRPQPLLHDGVGVTLLPTAALLQHRRRTAGTGLLRSRRVPLIGTLQRRPESQCRRSV
jgi:hypothetical protein